MCVLTGCDFLSSVPGIGIKWAHSLVLKYKNIDRVLSVLQLDKKRRIPEGYVNYFKEANVVFHHDRVYDVDMPFIIEAIARRILPGIRWQS
jgi:exonuclease-1